MNPTKVKEWLVLAGIVGGVVMWFATMYGLPPRVDRLEEKVSEHEGRLARSDVKLDMIADDVKSIKVMLLRASALKGGEK